MNNISLDFRTISQHGGQEIRPYFVIGGRNAPNERLNDIADILREDGLEIISVTPRYRAETSLNPDYQGIAIFVQKHLEDDADHAAGHAQGFDIGETYEKIRNRFQEMPIDPHATEGLQVIINKVNELEELGEIFVQMQPQYGGAKDVLARINQRTVLPEVLESDGLEIAEEMPQQPCDLPFDPPWHPQGDALPPRAPPPVEVAPVRDIETARPMSFKEASIWTGISATVGFIYAKVVSINPLVTTAVFAINVLALLAIRMIGSRFTEMGTRRREMMINLGECAVTLVGASAFYGLNIIALPGTLAMVVLSICKLTIDIAQLNAKFRAIEAH